jgi:stress response protein YsnF
MTSEQPYQNQAEKTFPTRKSLGYRGARKSLGPLRVNVKPVKVRIRKHVRTEREQLRVPKRHEEVHVERVPVEEGREA